MVNVCVVGGKGSIGSVMASWIGQFYPVRVADKSGGEATPEATKDADVVIVIVDTPSHPDGSYDVGNVIAACGEIDLFRYRTVIISSTVNPGDVEGPIRAALGRDELVAHDDFGLAYVPEFVRQGSIQTDFAHPAFVVAGSVTKAEQAMLDVFYEEVCGSCVTHMSVQSAEIVKIGLNSTITAKLAKANEIAWLCQMTPGADARDVLGTIILDRRVSPHYFQAGPPDGGPCFPRDDAAFAHALQKAHVFSELPTEVGRWRREQVWSMARLVGIGGKVGVAGLSYKSHYSDDTESPGVALAKALGAETYDLDLPSTCSSLKELADKCDVIVIAMPFEGMDALLSMDLDDKTVWDWWGLFGDRFNRFGKGQIC